MMILNDKIVHFEAKIQSLSEINCKKYETNKINILFIISPFFALKIFLENKILHSPTSPETLILKTVSQKTGKLYLL